MFMLIIDYSTACEVPTEVKATPTLDVTHGCIMAAMLPAPHHSSQTTPRNLHHVESEPIQEEVWWSYQDSSWWEGHG